MHNRETKRAQKRLAKLGRDAFAASAIWPENLFEMLACPLLGDGFVGLFLDQSSAIETRAAVVTIDSLRLVFVLTIRTNELGHA